MLIDAAKYEGGVLLLKTRDYEAKQFVNGFKPGEYELKKVYPKRSRNANSMCWVICDKIARVINDTKENVYRRAIKDVGVFEDIIIREQAVEAFMRRWPDNGIGWFAELVGDAATGKQVRVYYGSSTYNTMEMTRLIDWLVEEAKQLDIEVLSERERSLLIQEWQNQYEQAHKDAGNTAECQRASA